VAETQRHWRILGLIVLLSWLIGVLAVVLAA
jgi:hypothetical protein